MVATEKIRKTFFGCHGLGPWRFTFAANCVALQQIARNVRPPPRKAVASYESFTIADF